MIVAVGGAMVGVVTVVGGEVVVAGRVEGTGEGTDVGIDVGTEVGAVTGGGGFDVVVGICVLLGGTVGGETAVEGAPVPVG